MHGHNCHALSLFPSSILHLYLEANGYEVLHVFTGQCQRFPPISSSLVPGELEKSSVETRQSPRQVTASSLVRHWTLN